MLQAGVLAPLTVDIPAAESQTEPLTQMAPWFDFLRIESDLAMSFVDSARLHRSPEQSAISLGNARKALAEVRGGLMRPSRRRYFTEAEVFFLEQRCAKIETALETFRAATWASSQTGSVPPARTGRAERAGYLCR